MAGREARVYVGNLSSRTRASDLEYMFEKYGRVARCDLKTGFAFVEFDDARDAKDAIRGLDGKDVDGRQIRCEESRGPRADRGGFGRGGGGGQRSEWRLVVENVASMTSWQDLKDFARQAGNVLYTDVSMDRGRKTGVIEYAEYDDMRRALRDLDDTKLGGNYVRLSEERKQRGRDRSRSRSRSPRRSRRDRSDSRDRRRSRRSPSRSRSRSRSGERRKRSPSRSRSRSRSRSAAKDASRSRSRSPEQKPAAEEDRERSASRSRSRD